MLPGSRESDGVLGIDPAGFMLHAVVLEALYQAQ